MAARERVPEADAYGGAIVDAPGMSMEDYSRCMRKYLGGEYRAFIRFLVERLKIKPDGKILEIGPGPGWIGIWLAKALPSSQIVALELSADMRRVAERNRESEGVTNLAFLAGDAAAMSAFQDASFDGVISNGSLHHWTDPAAVFREIDRVLKPNGVVAVQDGRRDIGWFGWLIYYLLSSVMVLDRTIPGKQMRRGWKTSIWAGYTPEELHELLARANLSHWRVEKNTMEVLILSNGSR
jgi:ubiquinone/menaquinone biosynthesis C-methylase UbiE